MAGIGRIEQKMKNKLMLTDQSISVAFQDLNQLIVMAQQMATLSKSIANKIKEHGSQVSNDETILFKSYLIELGIEQQIDLGFGNTKGSIHQELAKQIESIVIPMMKHYKKDQLTLSDVYCIFNRARGIDLVSPDDILNACNFFKELKLVKQASGLIIVQNTSFDEEEAMREILKITKEATFLTPIKLSQMQKLSIQLSRNRLEQCEAVGLLCRDVTVEGLKFYPNYFLHRDDR